MIQADPNSAEKKDHIQSITDRDPSQENMKLKELDDELLDYLRKGNLDALIQFSPYFRKWRSSQQNPQLSTPIELTELIPNLLHLLSDDFSDHKSLHNEVGSLLAKISERSHEEFISLKATSALARAFESTHSENIKENIMTVFANITGEKNLDYIDHLLKQGVLDKVVNQFGMPKQIAYYRVAARLICNLVCGSPYPPSQQMQNVWTALVHLLHRPDKAIQEHTLLSLAYLSEKPQENHIKGIIENQLSSQIIQLISNQDEKVAAIAVKILVNLVIENQLLISNYRGSEMSKALLKVLESSDSSLRRNACLLLSNILSSKEFSHHEYIDGYGGLESLIKLAAIDDEMDIRVQATVCLQKYLESAEERVATKAMKKGLLEIFLQNLLSTEVKVIESSLCALHQTLEHGEKMKRQMGGVNSIAKKIKERDFFQVIEELQKHPNQDILKESQDILSKFFTKS